MLLVLRVWWRMGNGVAPENEASNEAQVKMSGGMVQSEKPWGNFWPDVDSCTSTTCTTPPDVYLRRWNRDLAIVLQYRVSFQGQGLLSLGMRLATQSHSQVWVWSWSHSLIPKSGYEAGHTVLFPSLGMRLVTQSHSQVMVRGWSHSLIPKSGYEAGHTVLFPSHGTRLVTSPNSEAIGIVHVSLSHLVPLHQRYM